MLVQLALLALSPLAHGGPPAVDAPDDALPRRAWDWQHTTLEVTVDLDARSIEGHVVHEVEPTGLSAARLRMHQVGLDIDRVEVDGEPVTDWALGPSTLDLTVAPDTAHTVEVWWSARPRTGVHFRDAADTPDGVDEAWTQGEGIDHRHWFPTWDHPSDRYTVDLVLTVPEGLHAVGNGVLQGTEPAADREGFTTWRYHFPQDMVTYLVAFTVGEHTVVQDASERVALEYVVPEGMDEAVVRRNLGHTAPMMDWFEDLLDEPYPYDVYRQIVVQRFLYGGMENSSATILEGDLIALPGEDLHLRRAHGVAAHELAHQWFGDHVTCRGWRELWLNEGFASFYTALWDAHVHGPEAMAGQVRRWWWSRNTTRPVAARGWSKVDDRPNTAVYGRGAATLHMLRVWLGAERFDRAVAAYLDAQAPGLVETDDLRRAFEAEAGMHLGWFFDHWIHGYGSPDLTTRTQVRDGQLTVSLVQADADRPAYPGPVEVVWATEPAPAEAEGTAPPDGDAAAEASPADGPAPSPTLHRQTVWLTEGTTQLLAPAPHGVRWVSVDPQQGVLADWDHHQAPKAWLAQLAEAPDAGARLTAIRHLGQVEGRHDEAIAALVATAGGAHRLSPPGDPDLDPFVFEQAAIRSLGQLATDEARDALLALLDGPVGGVPRLRAATVEALGGFSLDEAVIRSLATEVGRRAQPPAVRAAALGALTSVSSRAGLDQARDALGGRDTTRQGTLTARALDVLREHGEPSDLRLTRRFLDDPRYSVQRDAGLAAVALAMEADGDRPRERLVPELVAWLDHDDQRTRRVALSLLGQLGHPDALGPLRAVRRSSLLEDERDRAQSAIERIRSYEDGPRDADALAEVRAALEALEEQLGALDERVGGLERW